MIEPIQRTNRVVLVIFSGLVLKENFALQLLIIRLVHHRGSLFKKRKLRLLLRICQISGVSFV